ncbi:hypothetical protein Tco_0364627 [Tanacetum coccineum]
MTTAGTRAVVNTSKGKMDNSLKNSRWVWNPKGNYMDHVSKEIGSFMLKKFEYADPKGIFKSVVAWLTEQTAPELSSPGPAHYLLMPGPINNELEILFQPMFDEYFETSTVDRLVPPPPTAQAPINPTGPSVSIPIDQEAPSVSHSPSSSDHQSSNVHHGVAAEHCVEINPFALADLVPFVNIFAPNPSSEASSL